MNKEKQIFSILLKEKEIILADRYDITLSEIVEFIVKYKELGVIEYKKQSILITPKGIIYAFNHRKELYLTKYQKEWEIVPPEFQGKRIAKNQQVRVNLKGV